METPCDKSKRPRLLARPTLILEKRAFAIIYWIKLEMLSTIGVFPPVIRPARKLMRAAMALSQLPALIDLLDIRK